MDLVLLLVLGVSCLPVLFVARVSRADARDHRHYLSASAAVTRGDPPPPTVEE